MTEITAEERRKTYPAMKDSGVPWLGETPNHWKTERAKWLFRKMEQPVRDNDEVVTCFRDGVVTLRKNRRVRGFTESLKEIGYQGVRRGDLVIHAMDAFAGAIGVSDSDGKGTPVYSVCSPRQSANTYYYAFCVREMARSEWILALAKGIRERSTDFRFNDFASQRVPLPPLPEQAANRPLPRSRRPAHPALHPGQAEADCAAGGAEAGPHPPSRHGQNRRPKRSAVSGLQAISCRGGWGCARALGSCCVETDIDATHRL